MILNVSDGEFYTARRILTDLANNDPHVRQWLERYWAQQCSYHWMLVEMVKQLADLSEARRIEVQTLLENSTRPMVFHLVSDAVLPNVTEATSTQDTEQFEQLQLEWVEQ